METKKSRMLTLLACLFVLFTNHVQAQDNDELQRLIDLVASAPITRAGETVREIDLSPYTEPRTTTLYIRNGANVRFVNGTLTREKNLNEPLVEIQGDSKLELASSATLKGEGPLSPIVLISAGELVVKGGVIDGMPYEESKVTNDTRRRTKSDSYSYPPGEPIYVYRIASSVSIVAESGSSFIMESGTLTSSVINSGNNMLQITGGTIADISTSLSDVFIGGTVNINQVKLLGNSRIGLVSHITEELPIKDVSSGESAIYGYGYTLTTYDLDNVWFIDDYKPVLANNTITAEEWGKNRVVSYRKPGHLAYMSEGNQEITETLSLAGKVNGDDIAMIRNIGNKALKTLDLSHASIVSGGGNYYTKQRPIPPGFYGGVFTYDRYYTENDTISFHMFGDLEKLESISLPVGVRVIEDEAFQNCKNLQKLTETSNHLQVIAGSAFNGCTSLKEFNLRYNPNLILDDGVVYDNNMTKVHAALPAMVSGAYSFPSSIKEINARSFLGCTGLTNIKMEESTITTIQNNTFSGCSALSDVVLPQCIEKIESNAFWGCNISNITLPMSLTEIATGAFGNNVINEIHNNSVYPPSIYQFKPNNGIIYNYFEEGSFEGTDTLTCKVYVPNESIASYKAAVGWKSFKCYFGNISNPNYIESEDDLQKRLDEIAAENPSKPVTLTIQDIGITIKKTIVANEGCNAIITGGKITVNKNFNFKSNCIFDNWGNLTFEDITIDGSSIFFENELFSNYGTLTIGNDVKYENIYQGELRYGFYVSTGTLIVYSGDLTLNGPIFYPSHGGKVFVYGGNFQTLNSKKNISGDDTVTILGASFSGGPINMRNLNLADMEADGIPDLNVSSINTSNINIYRVMKLPLINLSADGVMTLDWHYRVWHSPMEYQGKWRIASEWAKMELERPFVVSGYNDYPMTQDDFNNFEFIDMPNDREAYFDEATKSVKLRLKKDPNYIESEDDLQKRLNEIAAENPSEPVELTIAEEGIDIGFVYASAGCNAKITGGPIRVKNVNNGGDYAYAVFNGSKLTFKDITLDFGNKYQRNATFLVNGDLTIGYDVTFQNIYQGSEQTKGFFVTSNAKLNIYSGEITAHGSIVNSTSESKVYIWGGTLKSTSNDPTITGDASVFMRGGSVIGGNKVVIMVNYDIYIREFAKVNGESGATLIDAKSTYIEGGTLEGSNTYCKSGTIGTPQSVPKVLIDRIYVYGQNIVYGNVDLPMLYMNNDAKIQLASSMTNTWTINGDWKQFDITEPYTIVSGYNYYNYTVTKADYSKMQFANLPDDMEAVYNEDLKVVQLQKREVECDLQSLVDGLCDAAPGGNVPAPTDGVDIGCDDAPDPLQCAVDIIIDGGEDNVNPNNLKTICLCQANPDPYVVNEKPAIRVNPYSTLTISNYNIRSDKYENQSFLVRGTLIIDVNVHIYHFIRFIHIMPGGMVVWRGGHVEDVDEIVYNEGGTLVIEGDFDNGGKCFVNPEGGTLTIKNGSFNGNIENHGTLIIEGGEITGKVENSGTFTMTGGVVSNTVVNSTEVVFKNYGTFYFKGGIIGGYGSCLIYHAKGAVLRIEGGQFDFSHVTDYWIEAHDDFYIPGNYDFKPTVPMLIEPKVIVRVLYKWIYKFNIVFVSGRPEPRHPLFCGNDFTLSKDHFKFIDWQLPNKRWRWHLNVADNTIEPRDEEVEDEDDLQAYLNWLAENQQDESASTEANPQVLDLQERIITITEPIVLPVGSHVFFKNGRFAPKNAWSSERVFYVPSGSSVKMENVVVDMSSSIHYVVSGKTVCRYIFDVAGNLHFGLGCHIKGYVNKNYLPTDTYIPGAALRIAPTAHLYLDGGQFDDVVICVNSVVNIYLTVNLVYNIYFYIPTACRTNGFRILAPYNSYSLTAADMKKLLMFGALEWGAQADAQGYASLYKITYNVGDADGNGTIDIEDASAILNYIIGKPVPESFVLSAADINKDEKVDILDVTSLIKMLLKKP